MRPYQKYLAACLCGHITAQIGGQQDKPVRVVWALAAGQGKTLIYLLVAMMLKDCSSTKDRFKRIAVILPQKELTRQLDRVMLDNNITVIDSVIDERGFKGFGPHDLYIVDEADASIRQYAVAIDLK